MNKKEPSNADCLQRLVRRFEVRILARKYKNGALQTFRHEGEIPEDSKHYIHHSNLSRTLSHIGRLVMDRHKKMEPPVEIVVRIYPPNTAMNNQPADK